MAFSLTRLKDGLNSEGKFNSQIADIALGTYATGGVSVSPQALGLKVIYGARILGYKDSASGGYEIKWDYDNNKLMAFRSAGFTPAGTNSAPTVTTTTNATITAPVYTVGGALTQTTGATGITGVQAPTFTGTAVAAGVLAEVANAVDLTAVVVRVQFIGLGS
jgi:hypothetical protein